MVGDLVYLKISSMKEVMRFGNKGKLSRYVGPYKIVKPIESVFYEFKLPIRIAQVHLFIHVTMLKECISNAVSILPVEGLEVLLTFSYEEFLIEILDRQVKNLRNKEVAFLKVLWKKQLVENATWEAEVAMMSRYSHLFLCSSSLGLG